MDLPAYKKIVLLIMDGFGVASHSRGNAISYAEPQQLNWLLANYPAVTLQASGPLVGLPWGEMGNSEVGHLNIGAGRIVSQDLPRITASIQTGDFFRNEVFLNACDHVKKNNARLHLLGMVSSGGVHSYDEHLYALLGLAAEQGIHDVFIHMITDGRDTGERTAMQALEKLHTKIAQVGVGRIATVAGRFYAMDRGGHWGQTELMYQAMVNAQGEKAHSALDCIATNYAKNIYDEMIAPTVILDGNQQPIATVQEHDTIIFFNFRQDRALQLTCAFVAPERMDIPVKHEKIADLVFVTMTQYMQNLPVEIAFGPRKIENYLGDIIAKQGIKQFHVAETEKFAHVTSFFNGGTLDALPGEDRLFVPSPDNTNNYADHPEMSVEKIGDALVEKITNGDYGLYVANFANGDMVGHTGNMPATVLAVQAMDVQLRRIADAVLSVGGVFMITADHGNAEEKVSVQTGDINKDHTTAPVPFIVVANELKRKTPAKFGYDNLASLIPEGALSDIAPTILELYNLPKPAEMSGVSLLSVIEGRVDI
jgi:2,3-bisphosphoglycerate-independent phosphoglycerate mutase